MKISIKISRQKLSDKFALNDAEKKSSGSIIKGKKNEALIGIVQIYKKQ
jgi:hypothetical protein